MAATSLFRPLLHYLPATLSSTCSADTHICLPFPVSVFHRLKQNTRVAHASQPTTRRRANLAKNVHSCTRAGPSCNTLLSAPTRRKLVKVSFSIQDCTTAGFPVPLSRRPSPYRRLSPVRLSGRLSCLCDNIDHVHVCVRCL